MTQYATIAGHVTYTPGDGAPIIIPKGMVVEIELAPDSATMSWTNDDGAAGLTAIPLTQFKEYVSDGKISLQR